MHLPHCHLRAAVVAAWVLSAGAAWSQPARPSPCGDAVPILRGDTLSRIAQRCDVSEAALLSANPDIAGSGDLEVGTRLVVKQDAAALRSRLEGVTGRIGALASRAGEALEGAAGEVGSSVDGLLGQNQTLRDGLRQLGVPSVKALTASPTVAIFPRQGRPGTTVTLSAIGLPADTAVAVGAGPRQAAYEVLERIRTTADGTLDATVKVPEWAAGAGPLVFVVASGERPVRVRSDPFAVTGEADQPTRLRP